tara:strand:- start:14 stop:2923 length:2910 start_codon:yes stop_codon:yes gene_type:complete
MNSFLYRNLLSFSFLAIGVLSFSSVIAEESESAVLEEIVVTSQRTEESLQDVPIAVTALSAAMLDDQQIEGGSDLQLVTPSLSFRTSDSAGGSFNIRGITNLAVSATAESGVETHINDLPVGSYSLQEGDFFDLERIEVLRGPQGTLYGKNSVGGAINIITARPVMGEMLGRVKLENGSFNLRKMQTMFNLPLGDKMAVRVATSSTTRDGDIKNIYSKSTVSHINNRDHESWRVSFAWDVNDKTDITLIHDAFDEDSMRHMVNNSYCQRDPSLVFGCTPGGDQIFELTHPMATYVENLAVLTGILDFTPFTDMSGAPQGFWEANVRGLPRHIRDLDVSQFIVNHELNDNWDATFSAMRKDMMYDRTNTYVSEEMDALRFKDSVFFPGGFIPMSGYGPNCNIDDGTFGVYGGCITDTLNYPDGFERQQNPKTEREVFEARIRSNYDGDMNYLLGAIHTSSSNLSVYDIAANGLDALALVPPPVLTGGLPQGAVQLYAPLYRSSSISATRSTAIFGEVYYQASDRTTYTLGLRHTQDYKEQYGRSPFLSVIGFGSIGGGFTALPTIPNNTIPEFGDSWYGAGAVGDPEVSFENTTGRFVVDHILDENTLVYASVSQGFKGGGFNGPLDPELYPDSPQVFPSTDLLAFEVGIKKEIPAKGMRLNASAYMYDATDYQVTKIKNKTRVNEGIDVTMSGVEAEFLWIPPMAPEWKINASMSYETSEVADGTMILNPVNADLCLTSGCGDWHMMKDAADSEVFVVRKDVAAAIWQTWLAGGWAPFGLQSGVLIPAEFHGDRVSGQPTPVSFLQTGVAPGHLPSLAVRQYYEIMASIVCAQLGCSVSDIIMDGRMSDIGGNQLTHPELMANVGVQYTLNTSDYNVDFRLDAYTQGERYTSLFNLAFDKVESWTELNALISITPVEEDSNWRIDIYGQNITDEINVMHIGEATAPLGFAKQIFARPQATYGIRLSYDF